MVDPYFQNDAVTIFCGDCLDVLREMPDCSVDAVVTDPPYGLGREPDIAEVMRGWIENGYHEIKGKGFMGKEWDAFVPQPVVWREVMRVLKPGGHALVACGTRTQDWMAASLRFAGFEIRDTIGYLYDRNPVMQQLWETLDGEQRKMFMAAMGNDSLAVQCYGSGFPKSLSVDKAIDRAAGVEREASGTEPRRPNPRAMMPGGDGLRTTDASTRYDIPATEAARQWQGWGTSLKPAIELWTLCRKPLSEGTVAANVLAHGTGALNVDGCRIDAHDGTSTARTKIVVGDTPAPFGRGVAMGGNGSPLGRWPANLIHSGEPGVVELFPVSESRPGSTKPTAGSSWFTGEYKDGASSYPGDTGSAARFFYVPKASKADRDEGCEGMEEQRANADWPQNLDGNDKRGAKPRANNHPTVKPTDLCRYLCRLITPPNGIVLDPFMGSGSTGKAARLEGFRFIGIEREADYVEIAKARISVKRMVQEVLPL